MLHWGGRFAEPVTPRHVLEEMERSGAGQRPPRPLRTHFDLLDEVYRSSEPFVGDELSTLLQREPGVR